MPDTSARPVFANDSELERRLRRCFKSVGSLTRFAIRRGDLHDLQHVAVALLPLHELATTPG